MNSDDRNPIQIHHYPNPNPRTPTNPFYHLVYDLVFSTPQPTQRVSQSQHFCENLQISTSTRTMEMSGRKCASKSPKCPVPAPNSTASKGSDEFPPTVDEWATCPVDYRALGVDCGEVSVGLVAKKTFLQPKKTSTTTKHL